MVAYRSKKYAHKEPVQGCFWDEEETIPKTPKYAYEFPNALSSEHATSLCRGIMNPDDPDAGFKLLFEDYPGLDFDQTIIDGGLTAKSMLICGLPGTGKTTFVNKLITHIKKEVHNQVICLAPTHAAAGLIDGLTVHAFEREWRNACENPSARRTLQRKLYHTTHIIIDEVSMMQSTFYALFTNVKNTFPHISWILVGDFKQLPPVLDDLLQPKPDGMITTKKCTVAYEYSNAVSWLCGCHTVELTHCRRSDKDMFAYTQTLYKAVITKRSNDCDEEGDGMPSSTSFRDLHATNRNLAYTHSTRLMVNYECETNFVAGKETHEAPRDVKFDKKDKGLTLTRKTQSMLLCAGYPLVCFSTNKALGVHNSDRFEVVELKEETVVIKPVLKKAQRDAFSAEKIQAKDVERIEVRYIHKGDKREDIGVHRCFRPGFCITVHQSQGDTFEGKYTIYDWNHKYMYGEGRYVAFSRGQRCGDVQISEREWELPKELLAVP